MIVATLVAALGFLATAYITQTRGLRIGGTIVVPTLAIYTLKYFIALPVFVLSTAFGYLFLGAVRDRTLLYGRDEFVAALVGGSLAPFVAYAILVAIAPEQAISARPVVFLGSLLPGLAAYNIHQTKPAYRRQDILYATGLLVVLLGLGGLLISPRTAPLLGEAAPLVLFAATADVAVARGAVVEGYLAPNVDARTTVIALLTVGAVASEVVRRRFGVRLGVISLALLALFALTTQWLLVLFVLAFVVCYAVVWLVHRRTLIYGRVLISTACAIGVLVALGFTLAIPDATGLIFGERIPVLRGLSAIFVGVIAGVDAYSVHTTPPAERREQAALAVATFVALLVLARSVTEPFARGVLQEFGRTHVVVAAVVVIACLAVAAHYCIEKPSDEAVHSASVLSGGDGA
ncbi:poly-gamma-glutamate biosynthesis protein PgsC/CapC [Halobaculum marinum]|uniref:Poly-gamma-glutamate biosynthesis protein PgsC/CapC n=1 Tax=Halobaculum marinum TaxID=3031996 RepID=A0ABD5WVC5_9EURY|nr:poly-gamma-glutamate biosynthesis protein PgsC/CapC [Halobaculum sp. DT55]